MLEEKCEIFAIGNFDGIHQGHQALLKTLKEVAHNKAYGVIIFNPHPVVFLKKLENYLLTKVEDRKVLLKSYGVSKVIVLDFKQIYQLSPEEFVFKILKQQLGVKIIVTGSNFSFGYQQTGDVKLLTSLADKYHIQHLIVPDKVNNDGIVLSSSLVRKSIQNADLDTVYNILGRYYKISGIVVMSKKLGRILDCPTANIKLQDYIAPKYGVYAVYAIIDGVSYKAVANFGIRPTLEERQEFLEVHILDYNNNLYGKLIEIEFISFIRGEIKFASIDLLKQQITHDILSAKEIFANIK